jgi:pimeloyl-ACP methyl ester carboxylesterase
MSALTDFKIEFVTSIDGTKIGYRKIGTGPSVILVHGALQSSLNFTELAKALSNDFTVYIPDRRGRGLSGAYRSDDNLLSEAQDIQALIRNTDAHYIFGLSSGAIITLQTALLEPTLRKIALYEPPIPVYGNQFQQLGTSYGHAMQKGNLGKALISIFKGTGDTSFITLLPSFITVPVFNIMMKAQMKSKNDNELPLQELVPTFQHDLILVKESKLLFNKAKLIQANVLLLGGTKSQKYLKLVLDRLLTILPQVSRFEFEKQGHLASDNSCSPQKVADVLIPFFKK